MHDDARLFGDQGRVGLILPRLVAEASYRARKRRRKLLGNGFCCDYGTDLLLMMYLAHGCKVGLDCASAALELGAPVSIIDRWMDALVTKKLARPIEMPNGSALFTITDQGSFVIDDSSDLLRLA